VYTFADGEIALTDVNGSNQPNPVRKRIMAASRVQGVETGWTVLKPLATVEVAFTPDPGGAADALGIISITYTGPR
jgi:hypothetical protein